MSLPERYHVYIRNIYQRPGSTQRPDPIETLHAAVIRQFMTKSGALYELCASAAITPLRGAIGARKRGRRIDGMRNLLGVLAGFVDHMAVQATPSRGHLLGRAVTIQLIGKALRMHMRTLDRHLRDLKKIGLVEIIQRSHGRVSIKFMTTKLLVATGTLRAFGRAAEKQSAQEREAEASAIAAIETIFAAAQAAATVKRAEQSRRARARPAAPPDPPLPDAPPDVQSCMRTIRSTLAALPV